MPTKHLLYSYINSYVIETHFRKSRKASSTMFQNNTSLCIPGDPIKCLDTLVVSKSPKFFSYIILTRRVKNF